MESNHLHQYSLVSAVMEGVGNDGLPAPEVTKKGNHGLGTFRELNGEMILVDGEIFQMTVDGRVRRADDMILPFCQVTNFAPTHVERAINLDDTSLLSRLQTSHQDSDNMFIAVRIEGTFSKVSTRAAPKQQHPGQRALDLIKSQVITKFEDMSGTLIGFRSPEYSYGLSVPGVHVHFVSSDRQFGGHVFGFELAEGVLSTAVVKDVHIELPHTAAFNRAPLQSNRDLVKVEKAPEGS